MQFSGPADTFKCMLSNSLTSFLIQHRCYDIYMCVSIADQTVTLSLDSSVDGIFTIQPDTDKILVLDGSKLDRYVVALFQGCPH